MQESSQVSIETNLPLRISFVPHSSKVGGNNFIALSPVFSIVWPIKYAMFNFLNPQLNLDNVKANSGNSYDQRGIAKA
jgi:hypothetical protein